MKQLIILLMLLCCFSCIEKKQKQLQNDKDQVTDTTMTVVNKIMLEGIWELNKVNDTIFDIDQIFGFDERQPTLSFDLKKGNIGGYSGCNSFGGPALFSDTEIKLTEHVIATQRGCGDNIWETDFFNRLMDIQTYSIEKETLHISGKDGNTLTFKQID